jgi:putative endonuclease
VKLRHGRGLAGEQAAEEALAAAGLTVVARRFRCRMGEIDLVAWEGPVLVFVEVKRRASVSHGTPAESVDARKRARLARAAAVWLAATTESRRLVVSTWWRSAMDPGAASFRTTCATLFGSGGPAEATVCSPGRNGRE